MINASAIVLAGGKGKRLGMNKPFIKLKEQYIIEFVVGKLMEIFDEIIIVTSKRNYQPIIQLWSENNSKSSPRIVLDKIANKGPLGGLFTGLLANKKPYAFVCACDMPFLNKRLIQYLSKKIDNYDAVVPEPSPECYETLHSFYAKTCLGVIKRNIEENRLGMHQLLQFLRVFYVPSDKIKKFDPLMKSFTNINTRADLKKFQNGILF